MMKIYFASTEYVFIFIDTSKNSVNDNIIYKSGPQSFSNMSFMRSFFHKKNKINSLKKKDES